MSSAKHQYLLQLPGALQVLLELPKPLFEDPAACLLLGAYLPGVELLDVSCKKSKGLVTTPTVKMPISRATRATTGAAPVPVPPPMTTIFLRFILVQPSGLLLGWVGAFFQTIPYPDDGSSAMVF